MDKKRRGEARLYMRGEDWVYLEMDGLFERRGLGFHTRGEEGLYEGVDWVYTEEKSGYI